MGDCQDRRNGDDAAIKGRIAKRATAALAKLPETGTSTGDERANALISAFRALLEDCSLAHAWSLEEAKSYERTLDFAEVALEYAATSGGEEAKRRAASCAQAQKTCYERCDREDGYICFVECRVVYLACLASVVTGSKL
jgi:hypothetical protein